MPENKTKLTDEPVMDFILQAPENRRTDSLRLNQIFQEISGFQPRMYGPSIIGYGTYDYSYASGHSGTAPATGFSPRKADLTLYIMSGYSNYDPILKDLGKYRLGKACLYLKRLTDVDEVVLRKLIRVGLDDLAKHWTIHPT
jgi:hypothetical protein